jgi:hypothetical protein
MRAFCGGKTPRVVLAPFSQLTSLCKFSLRNTLEVDGERAQGTLVTKEGSKETRTRCIFPQ